MQDIIAALVQFFLVDPLQAELAERLAGVRAPQELAREVFACLRADSAAVIQRATADPGWTITRGLGLWTGLVQPETVLADAAPGCQGAATKLRTALANG
jgi:hypothetical protein